MPDPARGDPTPCLAAPRDRAPAGLPGRISAIRSLGYPNYRRLWAAGLLLGFGNWMQRLTIGWLVLDETGSVFLTALSFAVRSAPNVVFGLIGGALADRLDRRRLLIVSAVIRIGVSAALGALALTGHVEVWAVLALVAISGITSTFEIPATQALVVDLVGRQNAANGIALFSVAIRSVGAVASMTGGVLITLLGPGWVFVAATGAFAAGGLAVATVRAESRARPVSSWNCLVRFVSRVPSCCATSTCAWPRALSRATWKSRDVAVADAVR